MPRFISIDSLAAVRIGSLWVPANKIPEALARYTRVLFCMTGVSDQPYAFRGSATALKWKEHHLLFCCRHQFIDFDPQDVVIPIDKVGKILVSGSAFTEIISQSRNSDEEILDICSMSFSPKDYGATNVERNFFDIKSADVWNGDRESTFMVFGYPASLRNLGFEDSSGALNNINTMMVVASATYGRASNAKHTHSIQLQRTGDWSSDGLSGGPVFHLGQDAQGFYCGFAGLVTRGSDTSDHLHFVDVRTMRDFFIFQENKVRTSGHRPTAAASAGAVSKA